ncbi:hypothetical protein NADFUDRAFT_71404 [Nadsonia fulvescens var. elongata DSM 6958]|uniref:Uncharacterized protein n=1 Tax=Nadsonia fulvescens var. elongata DSM 6958 TaxID=857566 RepID=A0A1E3PHF3_9ASCO|nr:hypothetical protein NADFUDRAFT_71404 [Nadsonia fulvescens var. elongata DSM 6958]
MGSFFFFSFSDRIYRNLTGQDDGGPTQKLTIRTSSNLKHSIAYAEKHSKLKSR